MSQNAKQSSLQFRRCATKGPFGLADVDDADVGCVLCVRLFGFLVCSCTFKMEAFTWPFMAVTGGR